MAYKTIKSLLKRQMKTNPTALWTWDIEDNNFTMIYEVYDLNARIYTPQQLLNKIKEHESGKKKNVQEDAEV